MGRGYFSTGLRWGNGGGKGAGSRTCPYRERGRGWEREKDGFPPPETFEQLPKRIHIVVWDDSCHS